MALKASEISQLIKERIENFEATAEARDVGTVIALPTVSFAFTASPTRVTARCSSSRGTPSAWR